MTSRATTAIIDDLPSYSTRPHQEVPADVWSFRRRSG